MKTLLLVPALFASEGGIERIMRLYTKALGELAAAGDDVIVLAFNDRAIPTDRLAPYHAPALHQVIGCGRNHWRFLRELWRHGRTADRLVCGHIHLFPIACLVQTLGRRAPCLMVAHGIEVWRTFSAFERWALRRARRILCVSDYTRRRIRHACPGLAEAQLTVLPNALDPYFTVAPDTGQAATAPRERRVILTVTRLNTGDAYKGVDTLIRSMREVRSRCPDAVLRIVGAGDDSARLRALAASTCPTGVEFAGYVPDDALRRELAACDVFALPSRKEGFGIVFLEAFAHGKPCIGARAGGIPEVIDDATGYLVDYGDEIALADACVAALQRPWETDTIRARADFFSYANFKTALGQMLRPGPVNPALSLVET